MHRKLFMHIKSLPVKILIKGNAIILLAEKWKNQKILNHVHDKYDNKIILITLHVKIILINYGAMGLYYV